MPLSISLQWVVSAEDSVRWTLDATTMLFDGLARIVGTQLGPDGIPCAAWRTVAVVFAPAKRRAMRYVMFDGPDLPQQFSLSTARRCQ